MTATSTTVRIPREAAGLGGVAWAYLAALTRGTRGTTEATGILATFREIYNENRSAVVDALVAVGGARSSAESIAPSTLRPSSTPTADDSTAIAASIYPMTEMGRLHGETGWGDADALFGVFSEVSETTDGLRTWFLDRLASVWPQGSSNAYARQLWWFAANISNGEQASSVFSQYVFQGRDEPEPAARGATSIQEAAAAVLGSEANPIELPGIAITARPSIWRSAWLYLIFGGVALSVGGTALWLWWYQKKHHGRFPWQRGKR